MQRIYTIPDIHGRSDLFDQLLSKLSKEENLDLMNDKLIFLGDYVDRGNDSKGVLDRIKELTSQHPNVIALKGNHEDMMIDAIVCGNDPYYLWTMNGGYKTLDSFPNRQVPDDYIKWVDSLPYIHEELGFIFSHSPLPRDNVRKVHLRGQPYSKEECTWTRTRNIQDEMSVPEVFPDKIGVCGHNHALSYKPMLLTPRFYDRYIFADAGCGCYPKAPLVAIEVNSRKVIYSYE